MMNVWGARTANYVIDHYALYTVIKISQVHHENIQLLCINTFLKSEVPYFTVSLTTENPYLGYNRNRTFHQQMTTSCHTTQNSKTSLLLSTHAREGTLKVISSLWNDYIQLLTVRDLKNIFTYAEPKASMIITKKIAEKSTIESY